MDGFTIPRQNKVYDERKLIKMKITGIIKTGFGILVAYILCGCSPGVTPVARPTINSWVLNSQPFMKIGIKEKTNESYGAVLLKMKIHPDINWSFQTDPEAAVTG